MRLEGEEGRDVDVPSRHLGDRSGAARSDTLLATDFARGPRPQRMSPVRTRGRRAGRRRRR